MEESRRNWEYKNKKLPGRQKLLINEGDPKVVKSSTNDEDSERAKLRGDIRDPGCTKSRIKTADSKRAKLRRSNDEPK